MTTPHLVTGATGFVGRAVAMRLASAGNVVIAPHRTTSDRSSVAALNEAGVTTVAFGEADELGRIVESTAPSTVYHLATHYVGRHRSTDVIPMMRANVELGAVLLDALVGSGARIVTAMSYFQYRGGVPVPNTLYSASKQAFASVIDYYRERAGMHIADVVLFDTYGPGDSRPKLVPTIVGAAMDGVPPRLGPRRQRIDLLYATDVADGLIAASRSGSATYALRSSETVTVGEVVSTVETIIGGALGVTYDDERETNDLFDRAGDWMTPAAWRPRVGLEEGMRLTLAAGSVCGANRSTG